ncbi:CIC11C00000002250 [Sungouiella intermedia]|uniref:CIC11C00000002250 n=1 Tax=Sungouiella intermedia TaxID=45354 RepID=A0A1L0E0Z7_9ASCO|nr:CIC11C00000002250 [[Candida] intermedia]
MTLTAKTIYERIQYIYSRNDEKFLTLRKQKGACLDKEVLWGDIKDASEFPKSIQTENLVVKATPYHLVFESETSDALFCGFVTSKIDPTTFDLWFMATILQNGSIGFTEADLSDSLSTLTLKSDNISEKIAQIFESTIKHCARIDKWSEGRPEFIQNIEFFTSRRLTIEAVLPAFPCKSSNISKVAGTTPDKGEELAIKSIITFVQLVSRIYQPGMKFYIVSDGHVFSDCINVDDNVVDAYTEGLKELYYKLKPDDFHSIIFRGLNDCFASDSKHLVEPLLADVTVDHFLNTQLDKETEVNRKIMMLGCDEDALMLRLQINTPQHPRLYLYRGFNKFMSDDLSQYQLNNQLSGKKYKKLVSNVAFEMIRRNDAYSNLVELMFPFHLRLSIHAHPNCGPKFGIRLLDPKICAPQNHDQDVEDRYLHIPTPWHNAVYVVEGLTKMIVGASSLASQFELEYVGGWNADEGCFVYTKK